MYWNERTGAALKMAYILHRDQTDKACIPYIFHPYRVADQMEHYRQYNVESLTVVALLHDVIEDTWVDWECLNKIAHYYGLTLTDDETRWLDAVTRRDGETYDDFITRAAQETESRIVKFEDVRDNLNRGLLGDPLPTSLVERYERAYNRLRGI